MSTLVLYASGHPYRYSNDEEEVRAISGENARRRTGLGTIDPEDPALHWWPSTVDFREEARRHARRPVSVGSFGAFLAAIRARRDLETVMFFGHGGPNLLKFGDNEYMRLADLSSADDVSSSFATGGRVILYACNAAVTPEFLQRFASALSVTVCGFGRGVQWTLQWNGESPNRQITWRGVAREAGDALPSGYTCASPSVSAVDGARTEFERGVFGGAGRLAGATRGGPRAPGPIGLDDPNAPAFAA
jgi:hypothetical protein